MSVRILISSLLATCLLSSAALAAAPLNDNIGRAFGISGTNQTVRGENKGATRESWEAQYSGALQGKSVWWYLDAAESGRLTIKTEGSNFDTMLVVFTYMNGRFLPAAVNDNTGNGISWSQLSISAQKGTRYYIAVDGASGAEGQIVLGVNRGESAVSFTATPTYPPTSKTPTTPAPSQLKTPVPKTTTPSVSSTKAPSSTAPKATPTPKVASSTIQGPIPPTVIIAAPIMPRGATPDDYMTRRYPTTISTVLNPLNDTWDTAFDLNDPSTANVARRRSSQREIRMLITGQRKMASSIETWQSSTESPFSRIKHVNSRLTPPASLFEGYGVWWKWTAPEDGTLLLDTRGSQFGTTLHVFDRDIRTATYTLNGTLVKAAIVDHGLNPINGIPRSIRVIEPWGWAALTTSGPNYRTGKYDVTVTGNNTFTISSSFPPNSAVNPVMRYLITDPMGGISSNPLDGRRLLAMNDDVNATLRSSHVRLMVTKGVTYHIGVDMDVSSSATIAGIVLGLDFVPGPKGLPPFKSLAPIIVEQPSISTTVPWNDGAQFTVKAEGTPPFTYQWQMNRIPISVLDNNTSNSQTFIIQNASLMHVGNYMVRVTDIFGAVTSNNSTLTIADRVWNRNYSYSMSQNHFNHTATLLLNGEVLIAGGMIRGVSFATATAPDIKSIAAIASTVNQTEWYSPTIGKWVTTLGSAGDMLISRGLHTATLLPGGKVLVTGGVNKLVGSNATVLSSSELFDPNLKTWANTRLITGATTQMGLCRYAHTATLLPNGQVLIAGGSGGAGSPFFPGAPLSSAELYNPALNTWTPTPAQLNDGPRYGHTATLLSNGQVLIVGGMGLNDAPLSSAEVYDSTKQKWTIIDGMQIPRYAHTATLLSDGKVLVVGGMSNNGSVLSSAEVYNPTTGLWSLTPGMSMDGGGGDIGRAYHTATLLPNKRVLIAGGVNNGTTLTVHSGSQLYEPAANPAFAVWLTGPISEIPMNRPSFSHTATLLSSGKVLVAGGATADSAFFFPFLGYDFTSLDESELYE